MGRRGYPPEFRRKVLDLVESGRSIADVAHDLDISTETIYTWHRQDRIALSVLDGYFTRQWRQTMATPPQ